jgi:hypothetical protein
MAKNPIPERIDMAATIPTAVPATKAGMHQILPDDAHL